MEVDPSWLRVLASADGGDAEPTQSIRPALAERLLAVHQQRLRRRSVTPQAAGTRWSDAAGDGRHLSDVLDQDPAGERPYLALGRIGAGGMGVVHLARQRSTGREVAVKAVHPDHQQSGYLAAFRRECRITASLEHPHVVPVYDAGADFMVMKRLIGRSLEERLRARGSELATAIETLLKVSDALAYAHARGVIHRDLKGENVMVGDFGEVWIMDWGLAAGFAPAASGEWIAPPVSERQEMCAGTPMCIAPEVALADPAALGPGIDLFMLGALLYRVLCGHYPYESPGGKESLRLAARREMSPLLERSPAAPFRLVQAAERAMAWEPDDRGDLTGFVADLRVWLHTSGAAVEAHGLVARAVAALVVGEAAATTGDRYRAMAQAIAEADRALALSPELRAAHEVARQARTAFAAAAQAAGDCTLATLVQRGFAPPVGR